MGVVVFVVVIVGLSGDVIVLEVIGFVEQIGVVLFYLKWIVLIVLIGIFFVLCMDIDVIEEVCWDDYENGLC